MSDAQPDDERPDSGVFLIEQAIREEGGKRASDRVWSEFMRGPWADLKRDLRRHFEEEMRQQGTIEDLARVNNEQTAQLGVIRANVHRLEANQNAVLDEVFGKRGLEGKRTGGLAELHDSIDELLRKQHCAVKGVRFIGASLLLIAGLVGWLLTNVRSLFDLFRLGVGGP